MKKIIAIVSVALLLGSCNLVGHRTVRGDGKLVDQDRQLRGFNVVNLSGAVDVELRQDSAFGVKVAADSNLQAYIETVVEGNILYVRQRNNSSISPSKKIRITVQGPSFRAISVSGASSLNAADSVHCGDLFDLDVDGASSADMKITGVAVNASSNGASTITLAGQAQRIKLEAGGSGEFKGYDFAVAEADIRLDGASGAKMNVSGQINGKLTGASKLHYKGEAKVNCSTEGASSVEKE